MENGDESMGLNGGWMDRMRILINWLTEMPADSTDLELVISCSSVSCLINMEPLELLRLQPNELIASESVDSWKPVQMESQT